MTTGRCLVVYLVVPMLVKSLRTRNYDGGPGNERRGRGLTRDTRTGGEPKAPRARHLGGISLSESARPRTRISIRLCKSPRAQSRGQSRPFNCDRRRRDDTYMTCSHAWQWPWIFLNSKYAIKRLRVDIYRWELSVHTRQIYAASIR